MLRRLINVLLVVIPAFLLWRWYDEYRYNLESERNRIFYTSKVCGILNMVSASSGGDYFQVGSDTSVIYNFLAAGRYINGEYFAFNYIAEKGDSLYKNENSDTVYVTHIKTGKKIWFVNHYEGYPKSVFYDARDVK